MKRLREVLLSRALMLLLMGLCLGFCFNMLLSSLLHASCPSQHLQPATAALTTPLRGNAPKKRKVVVGATWKASEASNHEYSAKDQTNLTLRYKTKEELRKVNDTLVSKGRPKRPMFVSTELGIRGKLLSAVLTKRETYETLAVAVNKTYRSTNSKLMFFMNFDSSNISLRGLSFVIFTHSRQFLLPILTLKHLAEKHIDTYNWFFVFPDSTYVDRDSLEVFIDQYAAGDVVVAGLLDAEDERFCHFEAGMLISQAALKAISAHLPKCLELVQPYLSASQNVILCLSSAFQDLRVICSVGKKVKYRSQTSASLGDPTDVISVSHLQQQRRFYQIHRQLTETKLKKLRSKLDEMENQGSSILAFTPRGNKTYTWPLGSNPQTTTKNRFDLLKWQYFSTSTLYHERLEQNYVPLEEADRQDVRNILKSVLDKLNVGSSERVTLKRLVNGYRRFDVARGAEYTLDLWLQRGDGERFVQRAYYLKPLAPVEVVASPYVSEASLVTLLLVVTIENRKHAVSFVDLFVQKCLTSNDNSELLVVLVYETAEEEAADVYSAIKAAVQSHSHQHGKRMRLTHVRNAICDHTLILQALNHVSTRVSPDSLVALCTPGMELKVDYINRVRLGTIQAFQAYFPIAFWAFQRNLLDNPPSPASPILINQKSGRYGAQFYAHASFYISDYLSAKREMLKEKNGNLSLYEMFVLYPHVNVLRAVDSSLRMSIEAFDCFRKDQKCMQIRKSFLASRYQMAKLLFHAINDTAPPLHGVKNNVERT